MHHKEVEAEEILFIHFKAVKENVEKLKEARVVNEVFYPEWLANIVIVKKKNEKWQVFVDFTDLNMACLKDPFPVPKIDQLVNATFGHPRMSFLDVFQGYHQIALVPKDQEKKFFHNSHGQLPLQCHAFVDTSFCTRLINFSP